MLADLESLIVLTAFDVVSLAKSNLVERTLTAFLNLALIKTNLFVLEVRSVLINFDFLPDLKVGTAFDVNWLLIKLVLSALEVGLVFKILG